MRIASQVTLDYAGAATAPLLGNLSAIAWDGARLWTASDEGRTIECLEPHGAGYRLQDQFALDRFIPGLSGARSHAELDLESLDYVDGQLWMCGSHCLVRRKPTAEGRLSPNVRARPSRCLFARVRTNPAGPGLGTAGSLPFSGPESLRRRLARDPFLSPFLKLASKENGLDIEGMVIVGDRALLGLRGPLLDSFAVVVSVAVGGGFRIAHSSMRFLDLGGLGIRDLTRHGPAVLVLAGPVTAAAGPFRLYRWEPTDSHAVQPAAELFAWPLGEEKPEGICLLARNGRDGILTVFDSADPRRRISGSRYLADWLTLD